MKHFSQVISIFHERLLPEEGCQLAGYVALIAIYNLKVPLPDICSAIGPRHKRYTTDDWSIYTPRHKPADTLTAHLTFALKYEGVDLAVLSALFEMIDHEEIASWVQSEPTSKYSRRIWFLYEWLTEKKLDLSDAETGNLVDVLDPKLQYPGPPETSKRHRVRNNLPGLRDFCPLVRRTPKLEQYIEMKLGELANEKVKKVGKHLLTRASAFLLLKDSRASFHIEQEFPKQERAKKWAEAIGQAGRHALSQEELLRLQAIVLEDNRFIKHGFRQEEGFIGIHDRTRMPIPDHISARWKDLDQLLNGILKTYDMLIKSPLDPIILATTISFGFVFVHPFFDGNGRVHRYLMHHIIAEGKFVAPGVVLPISAVILEHIDKYQEVLEAYSQPRLEFVEWKPTNKGNVAIFNETINLYRYFDATKQAEFLYDCTWQAVEQSLPKEIDYLKRYDHIKQEVKELFEMPDHMISLLIRFLEQNNGKLSKRAMKNEFKALSPNECKQLEILYLKHFGT